MSSSRELERIGGGARAGGPGSVSTEKVFQGAGLVCGQFLTTSVKNTIELGLTSLDRSRQQFL